MLTRQRTSHMRSQSSSRIHPKLLSRSGLALPPFPNPSALIQQHPPRTSTSQPAAILQAPPIYLIPLTRLQTTCTGRLVMSQPVSSRRSITQSPSLMHMPYEQRPTLRNIIKLVLRITSHPSIASRTRTTATACIDMQAFLPFPTKTLA